MVQATQTDPFVEKLLCATPSLGKINCTFYSASDSYTVVPRETLRAVRPPQSFSRRGWQLCRGAAPLCRGDCCAPHTPGLTRPCLIQPCVVGGSGVAVAPRHIRRRLECLWRRPGGHAAHIAGKSISSPCSDVAHLTGGRDDSTQHGVFCWFLAPTKT
jgi:hypothetical protein